MNPIDLFRQWFKEAQTTAKADGDHIHPEAMTLASVGADGKPSARIVLFKEIIDGDFVFYTNYASRKGQELEKNPYAALVFHWDSLRKQVRIEGKTQKTSSEISDAYWRTRPRGSQIGGVASKQSEKIQSRSQLENRVKEIEEQYKGKEIPRPEYWGGFRLTPTSIEFWSERPDRLHDRMLYAKDQGTWIMQRLSP